MSGFKHTVDRAGRTFVSKRAPVEPQWHKDLLPIAKAAGSSKPDGSPEVVAFRNLCRKLIASRMLCSFETHLNGSQVYKVSWIARDPQWSGVA